MTEYTFYQPPKSNIVFRLGKDSNVIFQSYVPKPPNAFQRWMLQKLLGIYIKVENNPLKEKDNKD